MSVKIGGKWRWGWWGIFSSGGSAVGRSHSWSLPIFGSCDLACGTKWHTLLSCRAFQPFTQWLQTKKESRHSVLLQRLKKMVWRGDPIARFNQLKSEIKYNRCLVNTVSNTVGKFLWLACWSYWGNKFWLCVCQLELKYNKFSMLFSRNSMVPTGCIASVLSFGT